MIVVGPNWPGSHAAVRVDNAGGGAPVLFDPGGSYGESTRGSGGYFEGTEANLTKYARYHARQEPVLVLRFKTTPEQEAEIAERFGYDSEEGTEDTTPGLCASSVSSSLSGIGPFSSLSPTLFPSTITRELFPKADSWSAFVPGSVNFRSGNMTMVRAP
jgi:hypothetical protein